MKSAKNSLEKVFKKTWGDCIFENNVDIIRKMYTDLGFSFSDWFYVEDLEKYEVKGASKSSECKGEYNVRWDKMKHAKDLNAASKPVVMSYDIECFSEDENKFPDFTSVIDVCFMIGVTFENLGDEKSRRYYCIYIGEEFVEPMKVDGREVVSIPVNCEKDLLVNFFKLIEKEKPVIFTGYNIGEFDNEYIFHRVNINGLTINGPGFMREKTNFFMRDPVAKNFWDDKKDLFKIDGSISIDVFDFAKKVHSTLSKHSLDYVSHHFLGENKHDVLPKEMFRIYRACKQAQLVRKYRKEEEVENASLLPTEQSWLDMNKDIDENEIGNRLFDMRKVALYCVQDTVLPLKLIKKLDIWTIQKELSSLMGLPIEKLLTEGEQSRSFSQVYNDLHNNGYILIPDKPDNMNSEGGYVSHPVEGLHEDVMIMDFASLYPSVIIAYNISWDTIVRDPTIPDSDCIIVEFSQMESQHDPLTGKIAKKGTKRYEELKKEIHYRLRFIKKEVHHGLLPDRMANLLSERRKCKKQKAKVDKEISGMTIFAEGHPEYDSEVVKKWEELKLLSSILEAKQLALKLSANSIYGFLKVRKGGKMPLPDGARAITAMGRYNIIKCNRMMTEDIVFLMSRLKPEDIPKELREYDLNTPCIVVYNDTDSCFVKAPHIRSEHVSLYGHLLQKAFSYHLEEPLVLEYEKSLKRVLLVTKKRYTGFVMNDATGDVLLDKKTKEPEIYTKGLVTARRDGCSFMRNLFAQVAKNILAKVNMVTCLSEIFSRIIDLLSAKVSAYDLYLMKKVGEEYDNENSEMNLFKNNLRMREQNVNEGAKIEYLYCVSSEDLIKLKGKAHTRDSAEKMGNRYWLDEEYKAGNTPEVDYVLYLDKIASPIDQIFSIAYKDPRLETIKVKKNRARIPISLSTPLEYASKMAYNIEEELYKKNPEITPKEACIGIRDRLSMHFDHVLDGLIMNN